MTNNNNTPANTSSCTVKALRLGESATACTMADGSSIQDILNHLDWTTEGFALKLNGRAASVTDRLSDGDIVTLNPKVEGGIGRVTVTHRATEVSRETMIADGEGTCTVQQALDGVGIKLDGHEIWLSRGETSSVVPGWAILKDGDVIALEGGVGFPKVEVETEKEEDMVAVLVRHYRNYKQYNEGIEGTDYSEKIVELPVGATVQDAIDASGAKADGHTMYLGLDCAEGEFVTGWTVLSDGDDVVIVGGDGFPSEEVKVEVEVEFVTLTPVKDESLGTVTVRYYEDFSDYEDHDENCGDEKTVAIVEGMTIQMAIDATGAKLDGNRMYDADDREEDEFVAGWKVVEDGDVIYIVGGDGFPESEEEYEEGDEEPCDCDACKEERMQAENAEIPVGDEQDAEPECAGCDMKENCLTYKEEEDEDVPAEYEIEAECMNCGTYIDEIDIPFGTPSRGFFVTCPVCGVTGKVSSGAFDVEFKIVTQ